MDIFPTVDDFVNEASQPSTFYPITKNVAIINSGGTVAQSISYRFKLRSGKYVAMVFTTESSNKVRINFGVIDIKTNKIIGRAYVDKYEIKMFYETQNEIYRRFFKENPTFFGFFV